MSEPTFELDAESLLSKWGFGDGDALSDWWWDSFGEDAPFNERNVLHALVIAFLVPALHDAGRDVEISWIETNHNPVRADTFDGVPVDHYDATSAWRIDPPVSVRVTRLQIEALVAKLSGTPARAALGEDQPR
ncbi:hypothetical protein [Microbacterium sp. CR_7]|uniref:hypothetical protein n=1 Tax=Microbacterium sp. CR_7 TaxID=3055792 RepID=UPI0035BF7878